MSKAKKPLLIAIAATAVLILTFFILIRPYINLKLGENDIANGNTDSAIDTLNKNYSTFLWDKSKSALEEAGLYYVGGSFEYGKYTQEESGEATPLSWDILAVSGGKLLVTTDGVIDCGVYESKADIVRMKNAGTEIVTWQSSTLRNWLNNDFITTAFTPEEAENIAVTDIKTDYRAHSDNAENKYNYVDKTEDKIFVFNASEAKKYLVGEDTLLAKASMYALNKEVKYDPVSNNAIFWLRSPGFNQDYAAYVNYDGTIYNGTEDSNSFVTTNPSTGIRPVMWVYYDTTAE